MYVLYAFVNMHLHNAYGCMLPKVI